MSKSNYQRLTSETSIRNNQGTGYGTTDTNIAFANGSTTEFFQLCDKITTNLFTINKAATTLEKSKKQVGTPSDSQSLRNRITQVNSEAGHNINDTTVLLRSIHSLTNGDKQRKIRAQKLQTEFQASATRFSAIQIKIVNTIRSARLPSDMVAAELDEASASDQLVQEGERIHAKKQEIQNLEFETAMLQEREHTVRELEADIVNINEIMRELSSLVSAQGEAVDSIEGNIDTAHSKVEEGREQLARAAAYQNKSRKRLCWLVSILLVLAVIVAIILGVHFSKGY